MKYYKINNTGYAAEDYPNADFYSYTPLTFTEYNLLLNPVPVPPNELEVARADKSKALDTWAYNFVSSGYADVATGFTLFCGEKDVANYGTLKNAIMDMADGAIVEIGTATGWETSTRGVVYPLLVRYSAYMLPFTTQYMKLKSYIEYSTTVEQINQIIWE